MTIKNGYDQQTADELREGAREDAQRCPDGFRCGHCIANDKAKREAARAQVAGAGLGMLAGVVRHTYPVAGLSQVRTFTREEVLTVLRTAKVLNASLDEVMRVFELIG